ncbi:cytochrome c oxidase subunit 3 [Acidobacteria bacterium AH-259-D05]|nr:cytochrome c oxidase subunit 3 [Acidobacteria bacterium AH-259-D05]
MHTQPMPSERTDYPPPGVLVASSAQLGLWVFLATVTMLFASFASAYLVRSASPDWKSIPLPVILWVNTAILILSSITLEASRSAARKAADRAAKNWFLIATVLGFLFLAGQLVGWRQLMARGFYIPTTPHSSFFYVLTGFHALHLVSGLLLLLYVFRRLWAAAEVPDGSSARVLTGLCATYWHFLAVLWIFLFVMLSLW